MCNLHKDIYVAFLLQPTQSARLQHGSDVTMDNAPVTLMSAMKKLTAWIRLTRAFLNVCTHIQCVLLYCLKNRSLKL